MFSANSSQVSNDANYIEDVFSTYLYTGNGNGFPQTITNGIDLAGKGGLVWLKSRSGYQSHGLFDTNRGEDPYLCTDLAVGQYNFSNGVVYNSNGFANKSNSYFGGTGAGGGATYSSWTFRKQPKFFDVVTYTGNGGSQLVNHSLASTPGCIIAKRTDSTGNWEVWHRDLNFGTDGLLLNSTAAATSGNSDISSVNSTRFGVTQTTAFNINVSGATYVAYLFAHNAGGFGLTGTDNVISCGSYTDGAGVSVNLGYEPQWLLVKAASSSSGWVLMDTMRGMNTTDDRYLQAQLSDAEGNFGSSYWHPTATGFYMPSAAVSAGTTMIYIAIRRGPMKVPTSGTSVYSATTNAGTGSNKTITTNFPVDLSIQSALSAATHVFTDRLRGGGVDVSPRLYSQFTNAETNTSGGRGILFDSNTSITNTSNYNNGVGDNYIYYGMRRAPSFFDEVCYTGDGTSSRVINHNLGVEPELIIKKPRNTATNSDWNTQVPALLGYSSNLVLNKTDANAGNGISYLFASGNATTLTLSSINTGYSNNTGTTYVVYLFATCAGVSKVGSYTGTGTTKQIDCGFTGGARFVLIKRTDSTGDWYVWDTARGIVSGNDPYLLLNSTAAEVTSTDYIDTYSAGFEISSTAPAAINASGGTFIFLAIA